MHTNAAGLALALRFGLTTELEMHGSHTRGNRERITDDDTLADVRSSGFGITPPGGHPANSSRRDSARAPHPARVRPRRRPS